MSGSKSKYVRGRDSKSAQKHKNDELRQDHLRNKGYNIIAIWEFNCQENLKVDESKKTREEQFPIQTTSETRISTC